MCPPHTWDLKLQFWGLPLIIPGHTVISSSICIQKCSSGLKKKKKNFHNVISFTLKVVRFHQIPGVWPNYQRLKSSKTHSHSYLKCCLTCACRQGQNLGSVQAYHKKVRGLPSSFWSLKRFTSSLPPPYLSHSLMAATNKTCCFWNIELKCPLWMTTFYTRTFSLCFIYVYNTHLIKL